MFWYIKGTDYFTIYNIRILERTLNSQPGRNLQVIMSMLLNMHPF